MGRKVGSLSINAKNFRSVNKPCMKEMVSFLNCLAGSHGDDAKCVQQKELLSQCIDSQSKANRKGFGTINYHLQRLSRGKK